MKVRNATVFQESAVFQKILRGRVALVTGGSSGIGREIARAFAEHGAADVLVADVSDSPREGGEPTHELINRETDCRAEFLICDVSRSSDVDAAVARAEELGGLDVIVNNAGIGIGDAITDMRDEDIDRLLAVNVKGVLYGCRAAARVFQPRRRGCILNTSSIIGYVGNADTSLYAASKGAIRLLSYSLAVELGPHGIRVNVLHPGVVATSMMADGGVTGEEEGLRNHIPAGRVGQPREVGQVAAFLASDMASYVHGASVPIDGGLAVAL